jgi:hypothetical protein
MQNKILTVYISAMGMLLVASPRAVFRIFAMHCGIAGGQTI